VGFAFVASAAYQLMALNLIARRIQPSLRWSPRFVRRATLKMVSGFGLWNMLFAISGLCLWSSDNIVIGRTLGPEAVPFYAIPFMLITYGRGVGFGFAAQMTPIAAAHFAQKDMAGLRTTLLRSTRAGLILVLATSGILVVVAEDLLRLWVGQTYASGWLIYAALMLSFWAVYASFPSHQILIGAGDIRRPAAISLTATSLTLVIKALALGWYGAGVQILPLLNCILVLPVVLIYVPLCACRLTGLSLTRLYRDAYLGPILAFIPVAATGWLVTRYLSPLSLVEFGASLVLLAGAYLLTALWTLSAPERTAIIGMIRSPKASFQRPRAASPG
jgi:O-antigen/teichoic acid export membrane protein